MTDPKDGEKFRPEDIKFNDASAWLDASYQVTSRETRSVESMIWQVSRQKAVAQKHMPTVQIPAGTKEWIIEIDDEPEQPVFDDNFLKEDLHEQRKSELTFYPVFMHYDYRIGMVDADAVRNSKFHKMSLPQQTIRNFSAGIADYREKVIWRGYDITGRASAAASRQGTIDSSSLGILNTSGINAFTAGIGNDANITAPGDGPASAADAAGELITDDFYGPYDFYMTPQVHSRFIENMNSTTSRSDMALMMELMDVKGNKLIKSWNVTKHLLPTAEANGTEANMCVIDPKDQTGAPTIIIGEAYPLHSIPNRGEAAVADSGKIVWSGIVAVLRPTAVALEQDITYSA